MTTRIVIAGAGGFGRELFSWIDSSPRFRERESVASVVFIDDSAPSVTPPAPIVSTIRDYVPKPGDAVLCAIGVPRFRRDVVERLQAKDAYFPTFVDDRVILGANVALGPGVIVCPGTVITTNISIGDHSHVNINCSIGHDVRIAEFVTLSPACNLMGGVELEEDVVVGTAATVIPRKRIGRMAIVGAGSVVVKNVPAEVTTFGNPSVTIRKAST